MEALHLLGFWQKLREESCGKISVLCRYATQPKGSSFICRSCPSFGRTTFFEFEDPECQAQGMFPYAKTHYH